MHDALSRVDLALLCDSQLDEASAWTIQGSYTRSVLDAVIIRIMST